MRWRKEPNNWRNSSTRFALTYPQRDVYHCLRGVVGEYVSSNPDREGYLERSEGIPYTDNELSVIAGEDITVVQGLKDILKEKGDIEVTSEGCWHFLGWEGVDHSKRKRKPSPVEKEYWDRGNQARLNLEYPDGLQEAVDKRIIALTNEGKLKPVAGGQNDEI